MILILNLLIQKFKYFIFISGLVILLLSSCSSNNSLDDKSIVENYNCDDFKINVQNDYRYLMAKDSFQKGDLVTTLSVYKELLKESIQEDSPIKTLFVLENLSIIYLKMNNLIKSEAMLVRMDVRNRGLSNVKYIAHYHENYGKLYRIKKKYKESLEHLNKAYRIYLHCKQVDRVIASLIQLGITYFAMGEKHFDKSIEHLKRAYYLSINTKKYTKISIIFYFYGKIYQLKKDYKNAIHFLQLALKYDKQYKYVHGIAQDLYEIAYTYYLQEKWDFAKHFFTRSYEVYKSIENKTNEIKTKIGEILEKLITLSRNSGDVLQENFYKKELKQYEPKKS